MAEAVELGIEGAARERELGLACEATYLLADVTTWLVWVGRLDQAASVAAAGLATQQRGLPSAMLHSARAEVDIHGASSTLPNNTWKMPLGQPARRLTLLTDGRTNPQIAKVLIISPKTARAHVSHILAKLNVRSRVEAAIAAQRLGL